jgi:hypothetical protein
LASWIVLPVGQLNVIVSPSQPDDRIGCEISCNGFVSGSDWGGAVMPGGITTVTSMSLLFVGTDGIPNGDGSGIL